VTGKLINPGSKRELVLAQFGSQRLLEDIGRADQTHPANIRYSDVSAYTYPDDDPERPEGCVRFTVSLEHLKQLGIGARVRD